MHKLIRLIGAWASAATLAFSLMLILSPAAQAQQRSRSTTQRRQPTAVRSASERGYLAGYSDGYNSGKSDYNAQTKRDFQNSDLYQQANRGYEPRFGDLADYQEGYRIGYEIAYTDGYYGRAFASQIPRNVLAMRSASTAPSANTAAGGVTPQSERASRTSLNIPNGTVMTLRLTSTISTKTSRAGDSFTATVISPKAYEEATVTGHIAKLDRSGKMTGRTELALEFDSIALGNGRTGAFHAQVEKIHASESVKSVDEEGNIESSSKSKDTAIRAGGGGALGAIIGGIAGGGKGAAIGAILGAGVGAGSVYIQGNKDLVLDPGTEMTVRTSAPRRESARP
jgi:hypothetical protein